MVKIKQDLIKPSQWARPQTKLKKVSGIVFHWVANPNSTAQANRNFFNNRTGSYGSAHYIIGLQGEIIQCLPDLEMGYHVGSHVYTAHSLLRLGSYPNDCTIGVEATHTDWDGRKTKATYQSMIDLAVHLLKKYGLTENDLWLHHTVVGWKDCDRWFVNNNSEWVKFKTEVGKQLRGEAKLNPEVNTKDVEVVEADASGMYAVKNGDTLWSLSQALNVTVDELKKLNPSIDPNALKVGQKIRVKEVNVGEHTVVKGDTLWGIATKYNTTVAKLEQLNKGIQAKALQVGGKIAVPSATSTKPAPKPVAQPKPEPKPAPKVDVLHLPASEDSWRVYPLNKEPKAGNESGKLNPKKFGGLKYDIIRYESNDVAVIKTGDYGTVKIYIHPSTGAKVTKGTGGTSAPAPAPAKHTHKYQKVGRATGAVWTHTKPNAKFTSDTRDVILAGNTSVQVCCEENGLYAISFTYENKTKNAWVSKKYIQIIGNIDDYDLPRVTLRRGSRGADVVRVQRALNKLYFKVGAEDGIFGATTEDAIKRFQSVHCNPVDGVYAQRTELAMERELRKK